MDGIGQDIPRLYTSIIEWLSCMTILLAVKNKHSKIKTVLLSSIFLFLWIVVSQVILPKSFVEQMIDWSISFLLIMCMLMCTCKISKYAVIYTGGLAWIMSKLIVSAASALFYCLKIYMHVNINIVLSVCIATVIVIGLVLYFKKQLYPEIVIQQIRSIEVLITATLVLLISIMPYLHIVTGFLVILCVCSILCICQYRLFLLIQAKESAAIANALKFQYEQYKNSQRSMEMVSIDFHYIKERIEELKDEEDDEKRQKEMDLLEEELKERSTGIQTDNYVLDTILWAKGSYGKRYHIDMICTVEGFLLAFMHVTDICAIFGNAIDNAIESVIMEEDFSKRRIHIDVSAQKHYVMIQITNPCAGNLIWKEDGLPATTKSNPDVHGFGLKTIRHSVKKYGGEMMVGVHDETFELLIQIPINVDYL